jgi:sn-glycerol 3-phosphate transport system ATP-binding protein
MEVAEVCLTGIVKSFGAGPVIEGVNFEAGSGRLVVLLGPSGCGKSTTLRLIAGLDAPDRGSIAIAGREVTGLPPSRRGVAMVFQSYALFPHLSVAENIVFGLKVRHVARTEREARLRRAAHLLGLTNLLARKPAELSGGQRQRVALGRAIVAEAAVCLMDEPLSNLDAQLRAEMRREIRSLQRRLGTTMIYVTHDQVEAMTMADQVVLMRAGRIEQDGPPVDLYERPATIFTARFVGTPPMNVVTAGAVMAANGALPVTPPDGNGLDRLSVGIRPEAVRIGAAGVPARIVALEYLGADTLIETRIGEEPFMVRHGGAFTGAPDGIVRLTWSEADTHWFETSSGRRVG